MKDGKIEFDIVEIYLLKNDSCCFENNKILINI